MKTVNAVRMSPKDTAWMGVADRVGNWSTFKFCSSIQSSIHVVGGPDSNTLWTYGVCFDGRFRQVYPLLRLNASARSQFRTSSVNNGVLASGRARNREFPRAPSDIVRVESSRRDVYELS